jgi:hypothetical protein
MNRVRFGEALLEPKVLYVVLPEFYEELSRFALSSRFVGENSSNFNNGVTLV